MQTQSAAVSVGEFCGIISPDLVKNLKFFTRKSLVLFSSFLGVLRYSHDLMQKKIAPIASVASARSDSVSAAECSFRKTLIGIAF